MKEKSYIRKRIVTAAIAISMILTGFTLIAGASDAAGPGETEVPTLRVYGHQNFGAGDISIRDPITNATVENPPYTDAIAPFNPQHAQAPVKDSITFNPIWISELESDDELVGRDVATSGPYNDRIKASGTDANEKVFMRQWYEPWHWDKDVNGDGDMYGPYYNEDRMHGDLQWLRYLPAHELQMLDWLDEEDEIYPAIMQEFTYMYVEADQIEDKPEPIFGDLSQGVNTLVFPIGIREDSQYQYLWDPYGYGLTGLDANFDGVPDPVHIFSEKKLFALTQIAADFNGDQQISGLDHDGYQLSGDELLILKTDEFKINRGARLQFLDHMIEVVDTFQRAGFSQRIDDIPAVKVAVWYTGDLEPEFLGYQLIGQNDMTLIGRKLPATYIKAVINGGGGTNLCDFPTGPWFIYVSAVDFDAEEAFITVGRAVGHTHTAMEDGNREQDLRHGDPWWLKRFYVDGHEYKVVAIETIDSTGQWGAESTNWGGAEQVLVNDLDIAWDEDDDDDFEPPDDSYWTDSTKFKWITIRTTIPKSGQRQNPDYHPDHYVEYAYRDEMYSLQGESDAMVRDYNWYHLIEQHSIRLQTYFINDYLSVCPPFNYEHSVILDIQKEWSGIWDMDDENWVTEPEWIGPLKTLVPPIVQTAGSYTTIDGRTIDPEFMMYVDEDLNPQYKGELKEKYWEYSDANKSALEDPAPFFDNRPYPNTNMTEGWFIEQWNTLPDEYTEFVLPQGGPVDEEHPYLYLLTSAFFSLQSRGRILNQVLGDDEILDEEIWDQPLNAIDPQLEDWFPSADPEDFDDLDGPFSGAFLAQYLARYFTPPPTLYGSLWDGSLTNGFIHMDGNRVKFWFDPAPLEEGEDAGDHKKYKCEDGIRIFGEETMGPGMIYAVDPLVPDRDGDGDPDVIESPPYTDPMAPFNPQSSQAPIKDSLTFDPAYMDEYEHGGEALSELYKLLSIEEGDAREKVFFRMWYEPWHWDKDCNADGSMYGGDAMWLLDPDFQEVLYWPVEWLQGEKYEGQDPPELYGRGGGNDNWEFLDSEDEIHPSLMQEFTYMYVNPYNLPDHGQPKTSSFAFPMATTYDQLYDCFGYGITTFDANFDGIEDIVRVHSENSLAAFTGIQADFDGDGTCQQLDADDIELNGNEIVVFAIEYMDLEDGDRVQFLDHMIEVTGITANMVTFRGYRTSGTTDECIQPTALGGIPLNLQVGEMGIIYHTEVRNVIPVGGNNLGRTDGAWFVYLHAMDEDATPRRCVITFGRALGDTFTAMDSADDQLDMTPGDPWYMKRFYVDGHEYDVVAIKTIHEENRTAGGWSNIKEEEYEFKYITIRSQIPKVPVVIEQHSTRKQEYLPCSDGQDHFLSVMPPFNYEHTAKRDIQAGWSDIEIFGDVSDGDYKGETIKNKPPVLMHIEKEEREPQFKGELKEKYNKRPIVNVQLSVYPPAVDATITGHVDGRGVSGKVFQDQKGTFRWWLDDEMAITPADMIYNPFGQDVSNFTGFFVETDYDGDGDLDWIMTMDWLPFAWGKNPWFGGNIMGVFEERWTVPEDYLCFFAIDDGPIDGSYIWTDDWEAWMTEQWHTFPDLYTEISIQQDDDQLCMLTNSWMSDESVIVVPYYEDGAISMGEWYNFSFFVPTFTLFDQLYLEFMTEWDDQYILIVLTDPIGNTYSPVFTAGFEVLKQTISIPGLAAPAVPLIMPGLWTVSINGILIDEAQDPASFYCNIEVRSTAVERVKFWYDPGECDDIYVNTAIIQDGGSGGDDMCRKGDGDRDMDVDIFDLDAFAQAYGATSCAAPNYDVDFDFDDDCDIDPIDLDRFANWAYGNTYGSGTCTAPPWEAWP